ncbi:hypothetical protein JPSP40_23610 [Staphylococcus pseudintermedius]
MHLQKSNSTSGADTFNPACRVGLRKILNRRVRNGMLGGVRGRIVN